MYFLRQEGEIQPCPEPKPEHCRFPAVGVIIKDCWAFPQPGKMPDRISRVSSISESGHAPYIPKSIPLWVGFLASVRRFLSPAMEEKLPAEERRKKDQSHPISSLFLPITFPKKSITRQPWRLKHASGMDLDLALKIKGYW